MGFKYKCFLDAYKGYHRVQMAKEDEEKTAFYTDHGTYCYVKMPFGLKNAGATYQKLVDTAFRSQIGRNLEAYADDMVTKSRTEKELLAEASGRLAKYTVELGAYNITYLPRNAIKGQVLADFINEIPIGPSDRGLVLINPNKEEYTYALRMNFDATNNGAEYEALLAGLRIAKDMHIKALDVRVDSNLVASQINRDFTAYTESMTKYLAKAKEYITCFERFKIKNIPRAQNQKADILSKLASVAFDHLTKEILVEVLEKPSTEEEAINAIVDEEEENWMSPIIRCLEEGIWPEDQNEARALRMKISHYTMIDGVLFKKSYLGPMLRCVGPLQANYVIREVHEGAYGMHSGPRFGLPKIIVTDNGSNFIGDPFKSWCERLNITQINTVVAHPQPNGLVERANKSLMKGFKSRLGRERAGWVDELPNVLWAFRTSLKTSNGETPFSLTYGSEAVIPAEIGMPTFRTMMTNARDNDDELNLNLNLLEERREMAAIREAKYKKKVEQYYNRRVRPEAFKVGDFVYRKNEASRVEDLGKLGPNWEGPYRIIEAYQHGTYKLQTMEDVEVPRTWHAINLKKCFM
ncbi:hypothetical protein CTI12_AA110840 [Artemisia annua]|uniref:Integrase catalytic domain-containing protein n=1 Tax=Artemisia annua TaxID=35608 RepID=A0A2U1PUK5_ARTAN|nr:hypothetical protein CTI12_AA110840 [Artemisia annua]